MSSSVRETSRRPRRVADVDSESGRRPTSGRPPSNLRNSRIAQQPIDIETITRNALANRTGYRAVAGKQLDNVDVNICFNKNQKLPIGQPSCRIRTTFAGGTQFQYGSDPIDGGVPPIISTNQRNFSDVLRDVFGNDFRSWNVAVNFSYPLGTSLADAALAQNRIQRQQGDVTMRELESITRQVRDAARNVQTTLKRVEATGKSASWRSVSWRPKSVSPSASPTPSASSATSATSPTRSAPS